MVQREDIGCLFESYSLAKSTEEACKKGVVKALFPACASSQQWREMWRQSHLPKPPTKKLPMKKTVSTSKFYKKSGKKQKNAVVTDGEQTVPPGASVVIDGVEKIASFEQPVDVAVTTEVEKAAEAASTSKRKKPANPTSTRSKRQRSKRVLELPTPSIPTCNEEVDYHCPLCGERYDDATIDEWIQCCVCLAWWHEECADVRGTQFKCDYCI